MSIQAISKTFILALSLTISTQNLHAIETSKCPQRFKLSANITRVYKTSLYSHTPGWKQAQEVLNSITGFELGYFLASKIKSSCFYKDHDGNTAVLLTSRFHDPEDSSPNLVDQLVIKTDMDGSLFVSYIPIKSYSQNSLQLYSYPYQVKIKTQLRNPQLNRQSNFDLGMISVLLK